MPNRFDFGGVDLTAGERSSGARPSDETPFCVAILGDFSGKATRGLTDSQSIGSRRAHLIDRDNFDDVLSSLKVEFHLPTKEHVPIVFQFSELDDFHPDRLFAHPVFSKLRELRERLENPSTFNQVAEELGLSKQPSSNAPRAELARATAPSAVALASGSLLDEMIEQTEARTSTQTASRKTDEVHEFARQLAAKYAVSAPDPRRPEFVAAVDRAIADVMRAVLHHPQFQALEAIWRATFFLVRQLETGERLKLYLFDISKAELAADLASANDIGSTGIFRLLEEKGIQTPGANPWALVIGDYSFGTSSGDVELLTRMARVAHRASAPFLAEADPQLLGAESLAATPHPRDWSPDSRQSQWNELRNLPEANSVGLTLPRILLRLPYGDKTSPIEEFDFEEFNGPPDHEHYLWGNPAFAVGLLIAQSFKEAGWEMRPGAISQIEKLPFHVYSSNGESESKSPAEVWFTEDALEKILEAGLMPMLSYKGRDSVRVARFQAISRPPKSLAGRWKS